MPDYTKNHVVPVALLRGFTDSSGRLCVFMPKTGRVLEEVASAAGVSRRTAYKWLKRFREAGPTRLLDRSSRPHRSPTRLAFEKGEIVVELRRSKRMTAAKISRRCWGELAPIRGT